MDQPAAAFMVGPFNVELNRFALVNNATIPDCVGPNPHRRQLVETFPAGWIFTM